MNILITGINGFVGSNLVAALRHENTLYGLDIISPHRDGIIQTFGWNEIDQIPSCDIVIHLSGKAHDIKNHSNAQSYFEINLGLTQKIYDWFLTSKATMFVYFSSVKAAADRVKGKILIESVVPAPVGPYGESKLAAEKYVLLNLPEDKHVYILRPCMIHGPGNKGNLNLLYEIVKRGFPWPLGAFDNQRSFCSIDNLCFIIQNLIETNIDSGIYQVADDQPLSTNELIKLIAESLGKEASIWRVNQTLIKLLAKTGDLMRLPLNSERLKKLVESYVVSNQKLKSALEIKSMPYSAVEGMKKTLNSFRSL